MTIDLSPIEQKIDGAIGKDTETRSEVGVEVNKELKVVQKMLVDPTQEARDEISRLKRRVYVELLDMDPSVLR